MPPVSSSYDASIQASIKAVSGKLSVAEIITAFDQTLQQPSFKKNTHAIWNLTCADIHHLSESDMLEVIAHMVASSKKRGAAYKVAIVAPSDVNFGLSRMFEAHGSQLPIAISIFRSMEHARQWISSTQ